MHLKKGEYSVSIIFPLSYIFLFSFTLAKYHSCIFEIKRSHRDCLHIKQISYYVRQHSNIVLDSCANPDIPSVCVCGGACPDNFF